MTVADVNPQLLERLARIQAAVRLDIPDRVPIALHAHFWPTRYAGMTCRQAMYDADALADAYRRALLEFQPDSYTHPFLIVGTGKVLEALGVRLLEWPGHGVGDNAPYQYLDKEYMKADEYDDYLFDPTGFMLNKYLPRVAEAYGGFTAFPDMPGSPYLSMVFAAANYARPELRQSMERLLSAGAEAGALMGRVMGFAGEMAQAGIPLDHGAFALSPFDYFADVFRGSKQAMLDMFRRKDKLLAAMDKASVILSRAAIEAARHGPVKTVFIPLHWGLDGFMSPEQFKTFYWPQLRQLMMTLIDAGLTPCPLWEGDCTSRLEIIADIPRGKAIYWFERTDIFRAKEILGDTVCLRGNVPASMLTTGTADDVSAYCRKLIDVVGKGGGFIMDGGIGIPDEAKPECVRAMFDTTRTYGVYN